MYLERIALGLMGLYITGLLLLPAHFYKGLCQLEVMIGPKGDPISCTLGTSLFWPIVLPLEFSFWLF